MNAKKMDKSWIKIGPVIDASKGEGQTGYQVTMLNRSKPSVYDCTEEVFSYIDNGRFGKYPNVMELMYIPLFDGNGVLHQLLQAGFFQNEANCLIDTSFALGTYAMFSYPITEKTLKSGDFFKLEGNVVHIAPDYSSKKDQLVYLEHRGAIAEPKNNMTFKLADDYDIYTWDWSKAKTPFSITCTREQAIANDFVSGYELGKPEDLENCYWVSFTSVRGNDKELDTVCCFLNKAPGWEY